MALLLGLNLSCHQAENESGPIPAHDNNLRFDVYGSFSTFNPTETCSGGSPLTFPLLYSYLCVRDTTGELEPDLAVSWAYDSEAFSWNILLRDHAFFHDGRPVTSADVAYSLMSCHVKSDPALVDMVKEITPVSDIRLCIHLKQDDPAFMKKISILEILPRPLDGETEGHARPVGSGPFQFASKTGDSQVVLTANPNYYLGPPSINSVIFFYEPDGEKSWTRLLSGKTDVVYELSPQNYDITRQYEDRFYFNHYPLNRYTILLYNTTDAMFADPLVRKALTHAIDRDYIISHFLKGYGKKATGPMGVDSPYHNPEVAPLPYDPKKSLELLKTAGWTESPTDHFLYKDGKLFKFTLNVIKEFPLEQAIARYIMLCFNDIGIQMAIELLPLDSIAQKYRRNTDFQAVLTEFSCEVLRPELHLEHWTPFYCGKSTAGGFAHPEVTKVLKQALSETDPAKKKLLLQKADALIADLQPGTFLFQRTAIDAMSKRFFLPPPFDLSQPGIRHLKDAVLVK